ncbi:hypothetical protein HMPREF1147_2018 [Selenomonas sp. FOBRC9]|nr:hypothetical protein HMPREF1147_2018 [Selenomonas sp. FOBRC9]
MSSVNYYKIGKTATKCDGLGRGKYGNGGMGGWGKWGFI